MLFNILERSTLVQGLEGKEKTVDSDGERLENLKFDSFQF